MKYKRKTNVYHEVEITWAAKISAFGPSLGWLYFYAKVCITFSLIYNEDGVCVQRGSKCDNKMLKVALHTV